MIWTAVNTGCADILLLGRLYDMDRCEYRCADILLLRVCNNMESYEWRIS